MNTTQESRLEDLRQITESIEELVETTAQLHRIREQLMLECHQSGVSKAEIARYAGMRRESAHYAILRAEARGNQKEATA